MQHEPKPRDGQGDIPAPLLAAHLDETAALLVVLDGEGCVRQANASARRILGRELCAGEDPFFRDHVQAALKGAPVVPSFLVRHEADDASTHICQWSFTRHQSDEGEIVLVGSGQEVTALHRERERFRASFDQESRYVCLLEPDGSVLEANLLSLEAMRLSAKDVVGVAFWDTGWFARSPQASDRIRAAVERAAAGERVGLELNLPGPGEDFRMVDVSFSPVRNRNGDVVMLLSEGSDVTELRLARDRETSMLKALATIGESAAILAHEIKNPITAIHYALQAVATELGEDQKAVIDDLVDRLKLLEKMMRRTLSFTRPLESTPKVCEIRTLLEHVLDDLQPVADRRGTRIELELVEDDALVTADPQLIGEVFSNLVTNALDALEDGGLVHLRVEPGAPGFHRIRVADDGPGIPDSLQATLFKPFFTTKSSGTGLGLALCRKILEEHGGSIDVDSTVTRGACFLVTLPAAG